VGPLHHRRPLRRRCALPFHASFDEKADADFGRGDLRIYSSRGVEPQEARPGLPSAAVHLAKKRGRRGGALEFTDKTTGRVYFKAEGNLPYRRDAWNGTLSFWLRLDPQRDLKPGYSDPIQVTDKAWNNAALWVDFSKDEVPRHFRYGAFADLEVWNPTGRTFEEIPPAERPWIVVERPPFAGDRWTHVVMTFSGFNLEGTAGVARLYLDGKLQGELKDRRQVYTWDPSKTVIYLGISYIGLMDDLAIFDRALSPREVELLHGLAGGVAELRGATGEG
jgi:hypothetical protein